MFRTIVVGCDGSPGSLAAIALAQRLRDPAGRIVLTSVRPLEVGEETAQEILRLSAKRIPDDVPVDLEAEAHGSVPGGLNDAAERVGADLIVLGPSHHHAAARFAGLMTVQRLLHGAPCAVVVAAQTPATGRILVGYDGSPEARRALKVAYGLAEHLRVEVELCRTIEPITYMGSYVAVVDPEFERTARAQAERELSAAAAEAPDGVSVITRSGYGGAAEVLLAGQDGVGLIVAGSRGYGTMHRAIAGSVSGSLLTRADVPVLVTPR